MIKRLVKFSCYILIACVFMYMALMTRSCFAGEPEPENAHFYIRYDNTTPDEGTQGEQQSYKYYFPIGETAPGWKPGDGTDKTSPDGEVSTDSAYIPGAENIVAAGHINLYHSFKVTESTIKDFFSPVYDNITVAPGKSEIKKSIEKYLGADWATAFENGNIDVLWYVIKPGQDGIIHVDGVLYYVSTGEIVDKKDPAPVEPVIPDPEPDTPITPEEPSVPEEPIAPDVEPSVPEAPDTTTIIEENNDNNIVAAKEEVIPDSDIPMAETLPETNDNSVLFLTGLEILSLFGFAGIILYLRKNQ